LKGSEESTTKTTYEQWMEQEGLPIAEGYGVEDITELPRKKLLYSREGEMEKSLNGDPQVIEHARQGVWNLVRNVADVQRGDNILIFNEYGQVDERLVALMVEAIKEQGALCHVMWGEPVELGRSSLPKVLIGAVVSADKVIHNYPSGLPGKSAGPSLLPKYLDKDKGPVRITNLFCTVEHMASEHARYPWKVVMALYNKVEEIFSSATRWRITTPSGTDIAGKVGKVSSRMAILEGQKSPFNVSFPTMTYCPVGSIEASGRIAVDHCAIPPIRIDHPPVVLFEGDRIVSVEGATEAAQQYRMALKQSREQYGDPADFLDSWHGGAHPEAKNVPGFIGHGCTARMHFHVGRTERYVSAGVIDQTIEVDGRKIFDRGKLMIIDDPVIGEAMQSCGLDSWHLAETV
jgi:hypothetical protein